MTRRLTRLMSATAAIGIAALALSACVVTPGFPLGHPSNGAPEPTASPSSTPTAAPSGVERYYSQTIHWEECGYEIECAKVIAPLDWDHPDAGDDITIAMNRHRATAGKVGSLFANFGGPGAAGTDYIEDYWNYFFSPALVARFDIIGFDPRGTGDTLPVQCYTDPDDIEEWLYGMPDHSWHEDPAEYIEEVQEAAVDYVEACEEHSADLQFIRTIDTARDLDLMRALVGDERLNYFGWSYGTMLGQAYIDAFPERVGRMVLDGVMDTSTGLFELVLGQQRGFELALTNFLDACPRLTLATCPFTSGTEAAKREINRLIVDLNRNPVRATDPRDDRWLDGGVVSTAIASALYSERMWPDLAEMFAELLAPTISTDTAFYLSDSYFQFVPGVGYPDNFYDAFTAISCSDWAVETDPRVLAQQSEAYAQAAPTTHDPSMPIFPDPICGSWPYPADGYWPRVVKGEGTPTILIVSTTGDPATPYENGVKLAEQLDNAFLLSYDGEGHLAYRGSGGDECVVDTVDNYLINGTLPSQDLFCR